MMKNVLIIAIAVFVFSFILVIAPDTSNAQPECCQIAEDACSDSEGDEPIKCLPDDLFLTQFVIKIQHNACLQPVMYRSYLNGE